MSWVPALRNDNLTLIFNGFTFLGYLPFFLIFLPMGYWLFDKPMFTRLAVLVGIVGLTNFFLKDLFQDPRPPIQYALDPRVGDSFGLPSGHAQIATAMWFWLAVELRRGWAWALAIIVAAGVGFSRLYLGVHDIEDVTAGTLLGLATVAIYHGFVFGNFEGLQKLSPIVWAIAAALLAPLFIAIWPKLPVPQTTIITLAGFMTVWLVGHTIQTSVIGHHRAASWIAAIISSVVAVAGMFAIFKFGGDALKAQGQSPEVVQMAQMLFMPLYATVIAPAIFRLVGLSRSEG
jgi:hypothetical protein